ncbi:MAG: hypothetical protein PHE47_04550 [Oscillospiraceae bacterium]|nr:hypothetical protein [Oscillospiraceae bacterium]
MPNSYDVDDILEEIKRKKSEKSTLGQGARQATPTAWDRVEMPPAEKVPLQEPQQPSSLDGLADFFGSNAKFDIGVRDKKVSGAPSSRRGQDTPEKPARRPEHAFVPEEPKAKRDVAAAAEETAYPAVDLNLDRWQADEEPEPSRQKGMEKTQMNIPLSTVREPEQAAAEEDLAKTQSIPAPRAAEHFDFEDLQRSLREQEDGFEPEPFFDPVERGEEEDEEDIDDFRTPADIAPIRHDLQSALFSLSVRLAVVAVLFAGSLYLALAQLAGAPLPPFMDLESQPQLYMIVNLALVIIAALTCNTTVGGGLASLLTLHADSDSLAALAVISTIGQGVAVAAFPQKLQEQSLGLFFVAAILGLFCNVWGKRTIISRIEGNFRIVSSERPKKAVLFLKNKELARELSRGMDLNPPNLVYASKTGFLTRFLEQSYEPDNSEGLFRVIAPVVTLCSLIVGGASYYLTRDIFTALTAFSAVVCVASPITATLYANYPLLRAQKALSKEGAQLTGFEAVDTFSMVNGVTVDASELFPSDNVLLHNIKMFEKRRIDEAILDASSALCSFDGTIKSVFMKIIQGKMEMLKKVENLVYEEGMGLSAWVDGKRVLIGNSALMRHHEIYTPSADYEAKYRVGGRDLIYLSNSGELTAMFVVSYQPDPQIAQALYALERKGIGLIVRSTDPNLTEEKIAQVYDLPGEMVHVIPAKLHSDFDIMTGRKDTAPAGLSFTGSVVSLFHGVTASVSIKSAIGLGTVMQIVGILLGYGIMTVFALLGGMQNVNGLAVIAFQLLWGGGTMLFSNLRKI